MGNYRRNRVNEEVQRELCSIIREIKDPRIARGIVSVTAVEVSGDLKYAKVFYSSIGKVAPEEVQKGLVSAAGFIRMQVAQRLNMRATPEFRFCRDNSIENGAHMADIFRSIADEQHDADGDGSEK